MPDQLPAQLGWRTVGGPVRTGWTAPTGSDTSEPTQRLGHTHTQVAAANTWVIDHGLGYPPAGVRVHALDGTELEAEITYPIPASRVVVTFPYGVSLPGIAYLS